MKRARAEIGISQEELGFRAKLNRTTISLYERGRREPGFDALAKLAGGLETTPNTLFEGVKWLPDQERFKVEKPRRR